MALSKPVMAVIAVVILLIIGMVIAFSVVKRAQNNPPIGAELINQKYANDDALQKFDFYPPKAQSNTLVIVVHGGAWVAGDKSYMNPVAKFFHGMGYPVVNMDYRLAPKWKYPSPLRDIASMINYANSHRTEFNLSDNFKIVLIGHSAGGHLVEMYGLKDSTYGTQGIWKVIALAGPSDLVNIEASRLRDVLADMILDDQTTKQDASPLYNIPSSDSTEYLLVVGSEDELVEERQITDFASALNQKGIYAEQLIVPGRTHNTIYSEINNPDDAVAEKIKSFLNEP
jgi:acetyl esterase/lipase